MSEQIKRGRGRPPGKSGRVVFTMEIRPDLLDWLKEEKYRRRLDSRRETLEKILDEVRGVE